MLIDLKLLFRVVFINVTLSLPKSFIIDPGKTCDGRRFFKFVLILIDLSLYHLYLLTVFRRIILQSQLAFSFEEVCGVFL